MARAEAIGAEEGAVLVRQFANEANVDIHRKTTAEEIWNDTDGTVDFVVCGIGTGVALVTGLLGRLRAWRASTIVSRATWAFAAGAATVLAALAGLTAWAP